MQLFTNFSSSPFDLISNIYPPIVVHRHKVFLESAFQFIPGGRGHPCRPLIGLLDPRKGAMVHTCASGLCLCTGP
jgi:hypothetical protein